MSGPDRSRRTVEVLAPCPGTVVPLSEVPDPVFAGEMVGPGVAIRPSGGRTTVCSPVAGKVLKVHPHAFVVLGDGGTGVLVHLGIDTNRLEGKGFEVLATEGSRLRAGDPVVTWDPSEVSAGGLSSMVPVVLMDAPKGSVTSPLEGRDTAAGEVLFTVG
ncbi:MAG: PTS glucose transporter subunit IIA [Nocardioidaceae bacterium]